MVGFSQGERPLGGACEKLQRLGLRSGNGTWG
jgi:hypothetical protein